MIIERRAYTLKPGTGPLFWQAQRDWNSSGTFADVLAVHNLAYFECVAGPENLIIELHKYESLNQWKDLGEHIARTGIGEYIAYVRPFILKQENGFYVPAPIDELRPEWAGGTLKSPEGYNRDNGIDISDLCVVETILDLQPGGPPLYWEAYRRFVAAVPDIAQHHLIFAHTSIIGTLHRVIHHRWFPGYAEADAYKRALDGSEDWIRFTASYRNWVVGDQSSYLRPSSIPWLRSIFDPGRLPGDEG